MRKQNRWKQILGIILTVAIMLASPMAILAETVEGETEMASEADIFVEENAGVLEEVEETLIEEDVVSDVATELDDEEGLLTMLFDRAVEIGPKASANSVGVDPRTRAYRKRIFGTDSGNLYDELRKKIAQIANGSLSSTFIEIQFSEVFKQTEFSAEDLGVDSIVKNNSITESANALQNKIDAVVQDMNLVLDALMVDAPYHFYWYDKTQTTQIGIDFPDGTFFAYNRDTDCIYLTNDGTFRYALKVSNDYGAGYDIDTTKTSAVSDAVNNAFAIVNNAAGKSDEQILIDYREKICTDVSYYQEAVDKNQSYGNPWQLIYVFDGDDSTNVVCEGYSKAFKFLCDLTDFSSEQIECGIVMGDMKTSGKDPGRHMWNIMHMEDGGNYLVDVTNCDTGSIGYPDRLFLVGTRDPRRFTNYTFFKNDGTVDYTIDTYGYVANNVTYIYDKDSIDLYSAEELELAHCDYGKHSWQETARHNATCTEDGSVTYTCSVCNTTKTEVIPAAEGGHDWKEISRTSATCTAAGSITSKCANCNTIKTEDIGALGHLWSTWEHDESGETHTRHCQRSGCTEPPESGAHTFGDATVIPSTCTEPGSKTAVCTVCKHEKTEVIKATGHVNGKWIKADNESHQLVCANDNTHILETAAHNWVENTRTDATCTEAATITYKCSVCNATKTETTGTSLGHEMTDWSSVNDKYHKRYCSHVNCSEAKVGEHDWKQSDVNRTSTHEEIKYECSVCRAQRIERKQINVSVSSVSISPASLDVNVGASRTLKASVTPSNASNKNVSWASSNSAIATVDANGKVSGKKVGEATITVTTADGKKKASCKVKVSFTDVPRSGKYYSEPVYWAVNNAITNGYTDSDKLARRFGPAQNCTRAEMVTFLWRMAGKPAPKTKRNPFKDVKTSAYYYKAVLWAVEKGITKGYAGNVFKPNATCLREHAVTFLWRYAGKPNVSSSKGFKDVKKSAYYYKAVLWAVNKKITNGYSGGVFKPGNDCLREHIVTFMYRYKK